MFHVVGLIAHTVMGIASLGVGVAILRGSWSLHAMRSTFAAALGGFFLLHGAVSLLMGIIGPQLHLLPRDAVMTTSLAFDGVATLMLVFVVARARGVTKRWQQTLSAATVQALEYERARREYEDLMRHRIANPLTVVRGAAETLLAAELDPDTQEKLLHAIVDASHALEQVSARAESISSEERILDALPHLDVAQSAHGRRRELALPV